NRKSENHETEIAIGDRKSEITSRNVQVAMRKIGNRKSAIDISSAERLESVIGPPLFWGLAHIHSPDTLDGGYLCDVFSLHSLAACPERVSCLCVWLPVLGSLLWD